MFDDLSPEEKKEIAAEEVDEQYDLYEIDYDAEIHKRQDSFLDSYSMYLQKKNDLNKNIVLRKAKELELIDPMFTFHIE